MRVIKYLVIVIIFSATSSIAVGRTFTRQLTPTPCTDVECWTSLEGSVSSLLFDGQRYHTIAEIRIPNPNPDPFDPFSIRDFESKYWASYEKNGQRVPLDANCDVHDFSELRPNCSMCTLNGRELRECTNDFRIGTMAYKDGKYYVSYGSNDGSFLTTFTLDSQGGPQQEGTAIALGSTGNIRDMFFYNGVLYLVGQETLTSLVNSMPTTINLEKYDPPNTQTTAHFFSNTRLTENEIYILYDRTDTEEPEDWEVLIIDRQSEAVKSRFSFGKADMQTCYGNLFARMELVGSELNFLYRLNNCFSNSPCRIAPYGCDNTYHWARFNLQGDKVSENTFDEPRNMTVSNLELISDENQLSLIATGSRNALPWWSLLGSPAGNQSNSTDLHTTTVRTTGSPSDVRTIGSPSEATENTESSTSITNWPWWAKTIFGTGVSVTGFAALTAASCLIKKAWNYHKYPNGKPDFMQKLYQHLKRNNQRSTRRRSDHHPAELPMVAPRPPISLGPDSTIDVNPVYVQPDGSEQNLPPYMEVMPPDPQAYEQPHIYETIVPTTGAAQVNTVPTGQAQEYQKPVASQVQGEMEPPGNTPDNPHTYELLPELLEIHQQSEQAPDDLDGLPVSVVSEEPWYANTNPGVVASAPIYTELNKPSARRALRCMEAMQSQQPGADPLGCVGPGQNPTYFHAMIQLEGVNPFTRLGKLKLKALAKGFDLVFRGMEAVDSYVYDFPLGHPKRTRVHTQHVSETLYGEHLSTVELFDSRIGDMEDPVIAFCNAMGNNVWHAFLVFRNSRTDEYNTLHIRQGSYYPEYMDKAATERYFMYEDKRIVGAFSLAKSAELYGATLDLKLLRDIFMQRSKSKEMKYRIRNQNCMTFSMLAFWATNFDWAAFLKKMGLANLQSPYHILQALAGSTRNRPAIHSQENNLLPDWLAELNQTDE